jgi:hypothetical protein
MMFVRGFVFRLVSFLVILALLAAGGSLLFRSGFSQGFLAGSLAAGAEGGTQVLPNLPYGMAPYGWYGHGFGFNPLGPILGLLFIGGLIVLFFSFFSRSFRHHGGPFGRWQSEGSDWGPGAWEARMKAWHEAHEAEKAGKKPEAEKETGEAPSD